MNKQDEKAHALPAQRQPGVARYAAYRTAATLASFGAHALLGVACQLRCARAPLPVVVTRTTQPRRPGDTAHGSDDAGSAHDR
jgi:hypothetical protein